MERVNDKLLVDSLKKPKVFVVKGYGEIRIQSGSERVNGVTLSQLKIIVKVLGVKNEQKSNFSATKQASARKTRTVSSRSTKSRRDDGHSSE